MKKMMSTTLMTNNVSKSVLDFFQKSGKEYLPSISPQSIMRGSVGDCFDTVFINSFLNSTYQYVEGIVFLSTENEWVYHAWLTDGVNAFDPTWKCFDNDGVERPMPSSFIYLGIELPVKKVKDFIEKTGYKSIIVNYSKDEKIAREILPDNFPFT